MHAPVTQSTGPERIRQPGWYFLRERGMNCSRMVRARLGKTPTEPCGEPSGFRKPNPTIPGGPSGVGFELIESGEDLAQKSTRHFHIGIENQKPGALRDSPAGIHTGGKAPVVRAKDHPLADAVERERLGQEPREALSTTTISQRPEENSGWSASAAVSSSTSGQLSWLTMITVSLGPWPARTVGQSSGVILLFHANDLESARRCARDLLIFGITQI